MKSHSKIPEVRRCRPLLGTFIEMKVQDYPEQRLNHAVDAAFCEVERIQNLMSVHDSRSELSQLNRNAFKQSISVSDDTYTVLKLGRSLSEQSMGAFDYSIGSTLARWGFIPKKRREFGASRWHDVELLSRNRVRFLKPLILDLGGIAKGYAVDRAVNVLQEYGIQSGVVNAGGDLRHFGSEPIQVHLRHPGDPHQLVHPVRVCNEGLATSSPYFTRRMFRRTQVSHLIQPVTSTPVVHSVSVTVRAPECWLADGLTKVVLNLKNRARNLLEEHGAEAFILAV